MATKRKSGATRMSQLGKKALQPWFDKKEMALIRAAARAENRSANVVYLRSRRASVIAASLTNCVPE